MQIAENQHRPVTADNLDIVRFQEYFSGDRIRPGGNRSVEGVGNFRIKSDRRDGVGRFRRLADRIHWPRAHLFKTRVIDRTAA